MSTEAAGATEAHQATTIAWNGITIQLRLTRNWMNGMAHHLELRASEPLPVTETGYRSHFFGASDDADLDEVITFVLNWLDDAAEHRSWQDFQERYRQGDLFDL